MNQHAKYEIYKTELSVYDDLLKDIEGDASWFY